MTPLVLYVLGEPGIGKTTLVRAFLRDALVRDEDGFPGPVRKVSYPAPPSPKWTLAGRTAAAGHYKGDAFDGADTIPYNGARAALEFWRDQIRPYTELTILDGARFATKPSLAFLREVPGIKVIGVHLVAPYDAVARRAQRCADAGTEPQNPSWVKGATTGARNFAKLIDAVEIDAKRSPLEIAGRVFDVVSFARAS